MEEIFHNLGETEKGKIKKDDRLRFKAQYRVWSKHIFKYVFKNMFGPHSIFLIKKNIVWSTLYISKI